VAAGFFITEADFENRAEFLRRRSSYYEWVELRLWEDRALLRIESSSVGEVTFMLKGRSHYPGVEFTDKRWPSYLFSGSIFSAGASTSIAGCVHSCSSNFTSAKSDKLSLLWAISVLDTEIFIAGQFMCCWIEYRAKGPSDFVVGVNFLAGVHSYLLWLRVMLESEPLCGSNHFTIKRLLGSLSTHFLLTNLL